VGDERMVPEEYSAMAEDAKALIELATRRFLEEVPALEPIKLVVGVELRGRGDVQQFRLEMPDVKVTKASAADARVRVEMRREFFNVMAKEGKVPDWIEAFTYGQAKATGPSSSEADHQSRRGSAGARAHAQSARKHDASADGSVVGRQLLGQERKRASRNRHITMREKFSFMGCVAEATAQQDRG
jgi:hypothetical protein